MKKTSLIVGLVVVSLGITACAGKGGFENRMFSKFDEDKDSYVDKTEYFAISTDRFERADANKDGKVSKKEAEDTFIAKRFPEKVNTWFLESDKNKNGYISNMEMREKSRDEFFVQDTNNDGKLSKKEMSDFRANQRNK